MSKSDTTIPLPTQAIRNRLIELAHPHAAHYAASDLDREVLAWLESVPSAGEIDESWFAPRSEGLGDEF
jgi:hypothetical protein